MYKVHQDAVMIPVEVECNDYIYQKDAVPAVSMSASRTDDGMMNFSFCNLDPNNAQELTCELRGGSVGLESGQVLTDNDMTAHNTFDEPRTLQPSSFSDVKSTDSGFSVTLPSKSVVVLRFRRT